MTSLRSRGTCSFAARKVKVDKRRDGLLESERPDEIAGIQQCLERRLGAIEEGSTHPIGKRISVLKNELRDAETAASRSTGMLVK